MAGDSGRLERLSEEQVCRRRGDLSLDESFLAVTWDPDGRRTPWLAELPRVAGDDPAVAA